MATKSKIINPFSRVSGLEVFYDLVFVLALSRVRTSVLGNADLGGLIKLLLLALLIWWAWVGFSWVGSLIRLDVPWVTITFMVSMGATFIVAVWMPGWYQGGAVAVTVAVAYLVVRLTYLVLLRAARHESDAIRLAYERSRWSVLLTAFALVIGAFVGGVVQVVLLLIAVCYEFIRPRLTKNTAFPFSVSHFTERYGLVVMAAIGEGLLALGATASGFSPSAQLLVYCIVGFVIDCLLWSAYFRVLSPQLRRSLKDVDPATAGSQARDVFSYLHLFFVFGLVLLASARTDLVTSAATTGLSGTPAVAGVGIAAAGWLAISAGCVLLRWRSHLAIPARTWGALGASLLFAASTRFASLWWILLLGLAIAALLAFPTRDESVRRAQKWSSSK